MYFGAMTDRSSGDEVNCQLWIIVGDRDVVWACELFIMIVDTWSWLISNFFIIKPNITDNDTHFRKTSPSSHFFLQNEAESPCRECFAKFSFQNSDFGFTFNPKMVRSPLSRQFFVIPAHWLLTHPQTKVKFCCSLRNEMLHKAKTIFVFLYLNGENFPKSFSAEFLLLQARM